VVNVAKVPGGRNRRVAGCVLILGELLIVHFGIADAAQAPGAAQETTLLVGAEDGCVHLSPLTDCEPVTRPLLTLPLVKLSEPLATEAMLTALVLRTAQVNRGQAGWLRYSGCPPECWCSGYCPSSGRQRWSKRSCRPA